MSLHHYCDSEFSDAGRLMYVMAILVMCSMTLRMMLGMLTVVTLSQAHKSQGTSVMERCALVVELESTVSLKLRHQVWDSMRFQDRIEFDEGIKNRDIVTVAQVTLRSNHTDVRSSSSPRAHSEMLD